MVLFDSNPQKLMVEAGDLKVHNAARTYPNMQMLSVPETLDGERFETPAVMGRARHPQQRIGL